MDNEAVIWAHGDAAQPRGEWRAVDWLTFTGPDHVPCRFGIVHPDGGTVAWTDSVSEARLFVRAAKMLDALQEE
jgi:hypothetical protein